ncbi:hypothetical protein C4561_03670 [candidate division WWE3 bacterium]|jgi:hypothetical protein|uniref:Uncharacterized protein n=1 Tax=candidate division WWE3 bacterium TaxID=2053526 RepID=A0A3A4ZJW3_UNCKA|nr:MAG: hypothetical protein C4561_03670 [candidate division WWE3 bacterium]
MFNELENALTSAAPPGERATQFTDIYSIASLIVNIFIGLGFSVSTIGLAWAFIQFLMTKGDPKAIEKARDAAFWSILGIMLSLMAVAIKTIVFRSFGANANGLINEDPGF